MADDTKADGTMASGTKADGVTAAPRGGRDEVVMTPGDGLIFALLSLVLLGSAGAFLTTWIRSDGWAREPLAHLVWGLVFGLVVAHYTLRWGLLLVMRRPTRRPPPAGLKVAAVTTFVPEFESLEMVEETLGAMLDMSFPHDTWLLDEGDQPEARELCRRLGVHYFSRKSRAEYRQPEGRFEIEAKHGNVNAWMAEIGYSSYDAVLTLDPDHLPIPGFLDAVLGHFDDPTVGYVQAAGAYYNQSASFVARGAAESTYGYYSCSEMASHGLDLVHGEGCHTTHRTAALKEIGGFQPHIGEDLLTSLAYRAAGWRGVYVPEILARGLTPVDWRGYINQQLRWARGELDIRLRHYPRFAGRLSPGARALGFLYSLHYVQDALLALLVLLTLVSALVSGQLPAPLELVSEPTFWALAAALGACALFRQRFYLGGRAERGLHWRGWLLWLARWPFVLRALADVVVRRGFTRPGAEASRKRPGGHGRVLQPHGWVAGLLAAAVGVGIARGTAGPAALAVAAVAIALSIGLVVSEYRRFPPPFSRDLARAWRRQGRSPPSACRKDP